MAALEFLAVAGVAGAALWVGWSALGRVVRAMLVVTVALGALATLAFGQRGSGASVPAGAPRSATGATAVGSGACRSCHPAEYASWHRSFHRTMTRLATPASVAGPFEGVKLEVDGRSVELSRHGDELWARVPDPDVVAHAALSGSANPADAAPLVARRVILATGSHHHEVYWVRGERGNELRLLPITYLIAERRYVPRRDAFLQPPDAPPHAIRWNSNCIQCHATLGAPRHDERNDEFASEAVELGIACEACHAAGAEHAGRHRSPFERWAARLENAADPTIVNPARLGAERASEVCGQCHAYFVPRDETAFWTSGFTSNYRPGDPLERSRVLLRLDAAPETARGASIEAEARSLFWQDGTIRVGGRELNGLLESACFRRGSGERRLSCLSCHSMHASDPDDQLRGGGADAPCARCHAEIARRPEAHTHHTPGSPGSSCVDCHMPFTSYALFKTIRAHRIDSPSAERTATTGRPNACNLCHLDRTLGWTAETLARWYDLRTPPHPRVASTTALVLEDLLAGDAAERAVAAAAFGRAEAHAAAGTDWEAGFLAELLDDPYAAVRKVACGSLTTLPGFEDFDCDFTAPAETRREHRAAALARFRTRENRRTDAALLLDTRGMPDENRVRTLLETRDATPTTISE